MTDAPDTTPCETELTGDVIATKGGAETPDLTEEQMAERIADAYRKRHIANALITIENVIGIANLTFQETLFVCMKHAMVTAMQAHATPQEGLDEFELMVKTALEKTRFNLAAEQVLPAGVTKQ